MTVEHVGPGGVSNSYGVRTTNSKVVYKNDDSYQDVFIPTGTVPVVATPSGPVVVSGDYIVQIPVTRATGRAKIGVFGNSIAGQSCSALPVATTSTDAVAARGATTLSLASTAGFVDGSKVAIQAYDGTIMRAVQTGAPAGSVITLTAPLEKSARSGAAVNIYTTAEAPLLRNSYGIMSTAISLLGGRVEPAVVGYGYGGASAADILLDLPGYIDRVSPRYLILHLFENDIATKTLAQLQSYARRAAEICIASGVVPIFVTPVPSASYTGAGISAVFDGIVSYLKTSIPALYPYALHVDVSSLWLDKTQPSNRYPLVGWTDGIHPVMGKQYTIATAVAPQLDAVIPDSDFSFADIAITPNPTLAGTTGTVQGGGTKSGVVATSFVSTTNSGATAVYSKNADESQKCVYTVASCTATSQNIQLETSATFVNSGLSSTQSVKAFTKLRINSKSNVDYHVLYLVMPGGEVHGLGVGAVDLLRTTDSEGRILTLESLPVRLPAGATSAIARYSVSPLIGGVAVAMDVDILEMGIVVSTDPA